MYVFSFDPLPWTFLNRCVFDENAQRISVDGRPKRIELYGVFKRKGINLDGALEGETTTLHVHHTVLYISLTFLQDYQVKMAIF